MIIAQMQFTNMKDDEYENIPNFLQWVCEQMSVSINTKVNRKKISLRIPYILKSSWISWINPKQIGLNISSLMECIEKSFIYKEYKDGIWKIEMDNTILIPNSYTSVLKIIRFINNGDYNTKATGMFTKLTNAFKNKHLNGLWKVFALEEFGIISNAKIISD